MQPFTTFVSTFQKHDQVGGQQHTPAIEALVKPTVSNHTGKKYMTVKLQKATRKLLVPTKMGTFCFRRDGASTGSYATKISIRRKQENDMKLAARGTYTVTSDH
jgi:hypothetical protein